MSSRFPDRDAVRAGLAEVMDGRATFPTAREFSGMGLDDLYTAARNKGGLKHWRRQFPGAELTNRHEERVRWQCDPGLTGVEVLSADGYDVWSGTARTATDAALAIAALGWERGDTFMVSTLAHALYHLPDPAPCHLDALSDTARQRGIEFATAVVRGEIADDMATQLEADAVRAVALKRARSTLWSCVELEPAPYDDADPVMFLSPSDRLTKRYLDVCIEHAGFDPHDLDTPHFSSWRP